MGQGGVPESVGLQKRPSRWVTRSDRSPGRIEAGDECARSPQDGHRQGARSSRSQDVASNHGHLVAGRAVRRPRHSSAAAWSVGAPSTLRGPRPPPHGVDVVHVGEHRAATGELGIAFHQRREDPIRRQEEPAVPVPNGGRVVPFTIPVDEGALRSSSATGWMRVLARKTGEVRSSPPGW